MENEQSATVDACKSRCPPFEIMTDYCLSVDQPKAGILSSLCGRQLKGFDIKLSSLVFFRDFLGTL